MSNPRLEFKVSVIEVNGAPISRNLIHNAVQEFSNQLEKALINEFPKNDNSPAFCDSKQKQRKVSVDLSLFPHEQSPPPGGGFFPSDDNAPKSIGNPHPCLEE